ncbi:MAG: signal recognition particle-docking protein FtsY [Nanoarchaeota archaeon]|nr:signal recognition particle-docking protein FtsY [Nanoarchaeota archaeon]
MFKFLKNKISQAVSKFSKKVEEEASEEEFVEEKEIELDGKKIEKEEKKLEEKKKKKEAELKKLEEDKIKKEEEKKKKEAEEQKKKEERLKKEEEERKKKEEERLEKEAELEKLEEETKKVEEELKKVKEEEKKKQEEAEKKKTEEERLEKEAELKRLEEETKEAEEEERQRREKEKEEDEKRKEKEEERKREEQKKIEEEKARLKEEEEQKRKKEEELKEIEEKKEEVEEKKGFFSKIKEILTKKKEVEPGQVLEGKDKELVVEEVTEFEDKGFLARVKQKVITKKISDKQFEGLFWDLELALMENNVAVEVVEKIKEDLKKEIVDRPLRKSEIQPTIIKGLKKSISGLFEIDPIDIVQQVKYNKKPFIIIFIGVNGSGKTTTIAKLAKLMLDNELKPIIAASDTFRAAAIHQLEEHGKKLGVKVIKHDYGADPSAVAFDAIKAAEANNYDVVLIDTAGRMHSNTNLIDEMKKIVRVTKPNMKIFVGEALAGNDVVTQSQAFDEAIDIDGIILTKSDIDEKGGAIVSVSHVTGKPIIYLGVGQGYDDIEKFDPKTVLERIGL